MALTVAVIWSSASVQHEMDLYVRDQPITGRQLEGNPGDICPVVAEVAWHLLAILATSVANVQVCFASCCFPVPMM